MKRTLFVALVLFAVGSGDASTKLKVGWKNPNYSGERFKKILVIGMSNNLETRADFEVALASKITRPGITGIAGTDILLRPTAGPLDLAYIREQIAAYKIDAVVVSRLVKVETKTTYIPGQAYVLPYYNTLYGYYGTVYPVVYSPDYLVKDRTVRIETNVYSVRPPDGELIWTGTSDTFNPRSAHKVIKPVVNLIVKELEKQAILPQAAD
jgi:hypothetical protein